jgi:hypothetical protein
VPELIDNELSPFHDRPNEKTLFSPLVGKRMLELGCKVNRGRAYKTYFESLGYEHISLDWNGDWGSLVRDLRKPLWEEFGTFDMVSNIGTTEHVTGDKTISDYMAQTAVWENIHRMTKVDGTYVGHTPYHNGKSWWWHGDWYPTEEFYETFAAWNDWQIERLYRERRPPFELLCCRMVKLRELDTVRVPLDLIHHNVIRPR